MLTKEVLERYVERSGPQYPRYWLRLAARPLLEITEDSFERLRASCGLRDNVCVFSTPDFAFGKAENEQIWQAA